MIVRELIERLKTAPPDSEMMIRNIDGSFRPATLVAFRSEDGTVTELDSVKVEGGTT